MVYGMVAHYSTKQSACVNFLTNIMSGIIIKICCNNGLQEMHRRKERLEIAQSQLVCRPLTTIIKTMMMTTMLCHLATHPTHLLKLFSSQLGNLTCDYEHNVSDTQWTVETLDSLRKYIIAMLKVKRHCKKGKGLNYGFIRFPGMN